MSQRIAAFKAHVTMLQDLLRICDESEKPDIKAKINDYQACIADPSLQTPAEREKAERKTDRMTRMLSASREKKAAADARAQRMLAKMRESKSPAIETKPAAKIAAPKAAESSKPAAKIAKPNKAA